MLWQSGYLLREGGIKMKTVKYMDEETVIKKAMQVLIKELGPVEAIRFVTIPKSKRIENIKRHREWQKMLSKDIFFDEVLRVNPHKP